MTPSSQWLCKALNYEGVQGHTLHWGMKKIINAVPDVVREACEGFALAHSELVVLNREPLYLARRNMPAQVALVSGGGSGHEPLHTGFVGRGMLAAACLGEVFTSPVPDQMLAATKAVAGEAGALYIIKNYTGDVMNFELAQELAQAEGLSVQSVTIDDDVAVQDSTFTAGRRGVAGTVFLEKIAGAAAEEGRDLSSVKAVAEDVIARSRSMGLALSGATVPAAGEPNFTLEDGEIELGIGIHGEPGRERTALKSADELVDALLEPVMSDLKLARGAEVILLTNGMGGTPLLELYIAHRHAAKVLEGKGVKVARHLVGNFVTSLEMQGFSLSVMQANDGLLKLWDAPVHTAALRWGHE